MSTHICLVSRQPLPNLLGALALQPQTVVLLTTREEQAVSHRLQALLERHGIWCRRETIDAYDPRTVRAACEAVLLEPPSEPVLLNATGGTKIAALAAVAEFRGAGDAAFYVNTDAQQIQWLLPPDRPAVPLALTLSIDDYLAVHGFVIAGDHAPDNPEQRRTLSTTIARDALKVGALLRYFRTLFFQVDAEGLPLARAVAACADDFPEDLGTVQQALLAKLAEQGMVRLDDGSVSAVRSTDDLRYLGGGGWLEEYAYLTLKDLGLDEVRANLVIRWGERRAEREVENEIDAVAVHRARLYLLSCKTGRILSDDRKDDIAQEEIFKLEGLRELAGGTYGRAMLVAGSRMTDRLKARCGRLGIRYVDAGDLRRLREHLRTWTGE
jgi:hypothetical protein